MVSDETGEKFLECQTLRSIETQTDKCSPHRQASGRFFKDDGSVDLSLCLFDYLLLKKDPYIRQPEQLNPITTGLI